MNKGPKCPKCKAEALFQGHFGSSKYYLCPNCGHYWGKEIIKRQIKKGV